MAPYVSRSNAMKRGLLCLRKTRTLVLRIQAGAPKDELAKAAGDVRHAELQIIKALLNDLEPGRIEDVTPLRLREIAHLQEKAEEWKRLTVEDIIRVNT